MFTLPLTHFLAKTILSRAYGGVHKTYGNSAGVGGGGATFVFKKWKFRGGGGDLHEIPSVVEVWIFSGTTHFGKQWRQPLPHYIKQWGEFTAPCVLINTVTPLIFQVCNKVLSCGHHRCERLCHADNCGDCPRTGERKCPCGQTSKYVVRAVSHLYM